MTSYGQRPLAVSYNQCFQSRIRMVQPMSHQVYHSIWKSANLLGFLVIRAWKLYQGIEFFEFRAKMPM